MIREMMSRLNLTIEAEAAGSKARAGRFRTLHGDVQTPLFMPVGTQATVKGQTVESLKASGARVLLANTYHLLLRPGMEVFKKFGGIHRFMNWDGPVLTDSGGFQIFSLPHSRALNEEGARFQSYVDGKTFLLSPETSIEMQVAIGADIMMALDQCIPSTASHEQAKCAMELTHRWADRSLRARGDSPQALFGIVQGACHHDLRRQSAAFLRQRPFDGLAIGGLAVGEPQKERYEVTGLVTDQLPKHLPRYLMGVGTPLDMLESVHRGIDMFDCIIPSQLAHRGAAFTSHGKVQCRRSVYKFSEAPLDARCSCLTCGQYSRAYLHHLVKADESLAWHLLTIHNMTFYHGLLAEIRASIMANEFLSFYEKRRTELAGTDENNPGVLPKKQKPPRAARQGDYEVHRSSQGYSSIRQISSGEVMHSVNRPGDEAELLYIGQSHLASRLLKPGSVPNPLIIWDVGLGAAFNAMAALACFEKILAANPDIPLRPIRLVSFECDLDPLVLAGKDPVGFPHLRHSAPHHLLKSGKWEHASALFSWELFKGDFLDRFESAGIPELIFYDPFSPKTNAPLWTEETFSRIRTHCEAGNTELYTYSSSTAVRVACLLAGFFVAAGVGTGPKAETTIAFTRPEGAANHLAAPRLLGAGWLARWRRSETKVPSGLTPEESSRVEKQIESHPQFSSLAAQ